MELQTIYEFKMCGIGVEGRHKRYNKKRKLVVYRAMYLKMQL